MATKNYWTGHHSTHSTSTAAPRTGRYLPGGTTTSVLGEQSSRVIQSGTDNTGMGRYSWVTLQGKENRTITMISAYRVCSTKTPGPFTAYSQQAHIMSLRGNTNPDPRQETIQDLTDLIQKKQELGHQIVLSIDANEDIQQNPKNTTGLQTLIQKTDLIDTSMILPNLADTRNTGSKIDYMLVSPAIVPAIERIGWYEYNAFAPSDHRAGFIDFNSAKLLHNGITNITHPSIRKLRLQCTTRVEKYLHAMRYLFDTRQLLPAVTELEEKAREHGWSEALEKIYNNIDREMTNIMIRAEKDCAPSQNRKNPWSTQLKEKGLTYRYWSLRLRQLDNLPVSQVQATSLRQYLNLQDITTERTQVIAQKK
jgi:hypothetical protein